MSMKVCERRDFQKGIVVFQKSILAALLFLLLFAAGSMQFFFIDHFKLVVPSVGE